MPHCNKIKKSCRKLRSNGKTKSPCQKSGRRGATVRAHTRPKGCATRKSQRIRVRDIENAAGCSERPLKQCVANCGFVTIIVILRKTAWLLRQLHPEIQRYVKDSFNCSEFNETVCMRVPKFVLYDYHKVLKKSGYPPPPASASNMSLYVYPFLMAVLTSSNIAFVTESNTYRNVKQSAATLTNARLVMLDLTDIPSQSFIDTMRHLDSLLHRGMPIAFCIMLVPGHAIPLTVCKNKFVLCNWSTCDRMTALDKLQEKYGSHSTPIIEIILCVHNSEAPIRSWNDST